MPVEHTTVPGNDADGEPTLEKLHDIGRTVSSSEEDIRGRMVKDKDGHDVGTIDGLLVDAAAGKVRFMEVASGGFLGLGETKSLIPVEAITRITEHEVSIGHTREHVAGAPLRPGARETGCGLPLRPVSVLRVRGWGRPVAHGLSPRRA